MVMPRREPKSSNKGPCGVKAVTFLPGSGYGDAGTSYIKGLHELGVPITWTPAIEEAGTWRFPSGIFRNAGNDLDAMLAGQADRNLRALRHLQIDYDILLAHVGTPTWWNRCLEAEPHSRTACYTAWETDRLPATWPEVLNRFDLVLVPSAFNRQAFIRSGVHTPVEVVPHAARPVEPISGPRFGDTSPDDFVFYTIGEWRTRKAIDETVRAYLDAFSADDKVALVIKTSAINFEAQQAVQEGFVEDPPSSYTSTWWTLSHIVATYRRPAKIHLLAKQTPVRRIDELHTRGDCFISLSHGEGWGLGAFDAVLFDNPTIITGWGGHTEYFPDDYPLFVNYDLVSAVQQAPDGRVIERDDSQRWAAADRAHASELMRWAFEHPSEIREIGRALGASVRQKYERRRVCERLARVFGFSV